MSISLSQWSAEYPISIWEGMGSNPIGDYITALTDWYKKNNVPLSQPIRKPKPFATHTRFPALSGSCVYLLRVLIGSLDCLRAL